MPMSNSAILVGIRERMRMNAPNVPARNNGGAGMKNGRVTSTP